MGGYFNTKLRLYILIGPPAPTPTPTLPTPSAGGALGVGWDGIGDGPEGGQDVCERASRGEPKPEGFQTI